MITIASKVKRLREERGLTQVEVADKVGYSRPTYMLIESGKKQLTVPELQRLAGILGTSLEEILFDTAQVATQDFGIEKYKQVILNCLHYGADSSDQKITKTKLAKLAYLADFTWFYDHLIPITGLSYRRIQQGPVPDQYFRVIDELYENGEIDVEPSGKAYMISAIDDVAPANRLSKDEIKTIKDVSEAWQDKPTQEVVEFTHQQIPWRVCRPGELIPYELITQEDPEHVFRPQLQR